MFARNGASRLLTSARLSAAQQAVIAGPSKQPIVAARCARLSTTSEAQAAVSDASGSSSVVEDNSKVHVKLNYLDPRTKSDASSSSKTSFVPLSSHVFGLEPRADVMHSAVVYYLDKQRMGTASTKTRGEVNFSGRKLRPQKGSGRARLGNRGNPLLRKGGVIFGPRPRDMSSKLPRRVRELALRSALSARWQEGNLHVVPSLQWIDPPRSTGPLRQLLGSKGWQDTLFLTAPRHPRPSPRSLMTDSRPSASDPVYTLEERLSHHASLHNFLVAITNIPRTEVIELDDLTDEARELAKNNPQMRSNKRRVNEEKAPGELHAYEVLLRKKVVLDLGAVEWLEEKLGGSAWHGVDEAEMREVLEAYGTALAEEGWEVEGEAEGEVQAEAEVKAGTTQAEAPKPAAPASA